MALHGIPTDEGISILNSDLREHVKKAYFMMHTSSSATFNDDPSKTLDEYVSDWQSQNGEVWEKDIYQAFFDAEGKLTFEIILKRSEDPPTTGKWMRGLILVYVDPNTSERKSVAVFIPPPIEKVVGLSLDITCKLDITGEENQLVFAEGDCATRDYVDSQLNEIYNTLELYGISDEDDDNGGGSGGGGTETTFDDRKLVTFEDLFYYFFLENNDFKKLYYNKLKKESALDVISGSASHVEEESKFVVEEAPCTFETDNIIYQNFRYWGFMVHVEADEIPEINYSIDGGNTWITCNPDIIVYTETDFNDLRFRFTLNNVNSAIYSFGVLYDRIENYFTITSIQWSQDPPHYWGETYDVVINVANFYEDQRELNYSVRVAYNQSKVTIEQDENQKDLFHVTYDSNSSGDYTFRYIFQVDDGSFVVMRAQDVLVKEKPLGARGIFGGGDANSLYNVIDFITISNEGTNASDFGDLTGKKNSLAATSNGTKDRGVFGGGWNDYHDYSNVIDCVTIPIKSDAEDFGDLYKPRYGLTATSNGTKDRGIFAAGYDGNNIFNVIDCVTISIKSDAEDFGDLTITNYAPAATSNSNADDDRGVIGGGGHSGSYFKNIDWVTISTKCDAQPFGELTEARKMLAATSNGTKNRGVFGGGRILNAYSVKTIDYITISSNGDAQPFGELQRKTDSLAATSNGVDDRGVFGGGYSSDGGVYFNIIDYITIPDDGTNAQPFGELTEARDNLAATSNA